MYRAYAETQVLNIRVGLHHESSSVLLVDQEGIRGGTVVRVTGEDGSDIPVSMRWLDGVLLGGDWGLVSRCVQGPVKLEPNFIPTWTVAVERLDGFPFVDGDYGIAVDMPDLRSVLRNQDGTRWSGRQMNATWRLQLTVRQVASRADRIASTGGSPPTHTFRGTHGMKLWTPTPVCSRSIPMTLAPGPLGRMFLMLGRYREAIAGYEKLVPIFSQGMTWDRSSLARAYVGAGDEAGAIRSFVSAGWWKAGLPRSCRNFGVW